LAVGSVDSTIKLWDLRNDKNSQKDQQSTLLKSHHMGSVTSMTWIKNMKSQMIGGLDKNERIDILASSSSSGDIYIHSNKTGIFN
jgi:WD40 repeat protein